LTLAIVAQSTVSAFIGATVIPVEGPEIPRGTVLVRDGRIEAVGPGDRIVVPAGAMVVDLRGKTIIPGLVDTHSHIGSGSGGDRSAAMHPDARIYDAINPADSSFVQALAGGVTTINIMPGSGHLMSGQTVYVKNRRKAKIDELWIAGADGRPMGGLKMANGTNPLGSPPEPGTRAKAMAMVRQKFIDAREYRDARRKDPASKPIDIGLEAMAEALDGTRMVHHHTHRADDILSVLRLQKEFGFRVVLHHVSEGHRVAAEIAAAKVPVSAIIIDAPGGKLEAVNLSFTVGVVLEKAGVRTAFHTDDGITDSRWFLRSAALALRAGMSRQAALESVTLAGAEMLDLRHRVGSIAPGKDADLVVLSGDPFSIYTKVEQTWVEGVRVFDRSQPKDLAYATGGFGVKHDHTPYLCCAEDYS